ncbi:hypothetical protein NHJ13734_002807 [Beauveria thailandica]
MQQPLRDRFGHMFHSNWTNTADFVRVLRDLIPPLAPYKQDAPADMTFEAAAGYDVPGLVF